MPFWKSARPHWLLALGALVFALLAAAAPARAEGITPLVAKIESGDDGYRLDAEFDHEGCAAEEGAQIGKLRGQHGALKEAR